VGRLSELLSHVALPRDETRDTDLSHVRQGEATDAATTRHPLSHVAPQGNATRDTTRRLASLASLTPVEEARIRQWLAQIGEVDKTVVADLLDRCRRDPLTLAEVLWMTVNPSGNPPWLH